MLRISGTTKLTPQDAVKKAVVFFGPGGYGLKVTAQTDACASFEGGGGGVSVTVHQEGKKTAIDLETREWEYQVKEFLQKIN